MPVTIERTKEILSRVKDFLDSRSREDYSERIPEGLYEDIISMMDELRYQLERDADRASVAYLRDLYSKLSREMTIGEVKDVFFAVTSLIARPREERIYRERMLEKRMSELEMELLHLRSYNPALQKKVAQMENELRKLRATSVGSFGSEEKEQKDMLKNYKEAKKKVFVIMPFAPMFDDIWKGGIERACSAEEIGCLRVDQISLSSWITEDIKGCMKIADFVVVDITGNNPNVMFELGWALAQEKKPVVIRQKDDPSSVPFDVKDIRYIPYVNSWSGVEQLYRDICKFLKSTAETTSMEGRPEKKEKSKAKSEK